MNYFMRSTRVKIELIRQLSQAFRLIEKRADKRLGVEDLQESMQLLLSLF